MAASFKLRHPIDFTGANRSIRELRHHRPLVWIDKGITIWPSTLRELRSANPGVRIVGYSPDSMADRPFNSRHFLRSLPEYDAFITTKSFGVAELGALGARKVVYSPSGYDPATHRPPVGTLDESAMRDACFIGTFEEERARSIVALCRSGIAVDVFGNGWERLRKSPPKGLRLNSAAIGAEYALQLRSHRIALCFLRKLSRDQHTQRSVEIPACGAFMLAERTPEHEELFKEGREAEYFASDEELVDKARRYLVDHRARERIAEAGRRRAVEGRYSYAWRLWTALDELGLRPPAMPDVEP